jgi:hypothetical protein
VTKITRKTQLVFGSSAPVNKIAKFGSLAAGAPAFSTDPETIQSLSQYLEGWTSAIIGSQSPAIEDMNALCYVFGYQIAYALQAGVAEYDDGTTYYIGSLANDGYGVLYASLTDANLGNALTDVTNWRNLSCGVASINPATQSPYTLAGSDNGRVFLVNSANGAMTFNLPAAAPGFTFTVKDVGGAARTSAISIVRHASENVEGLAATYSCSANYGQWQWACDGTNWWDIH